MSKINDNILVPKLRFPEFVNDEGWSEDGIGDKFKFKQGVQMPVESQYLIYQAGLVRFIRIIDVTNKEEPHRYIENPGNEHLIEENDLFMIRYGTPGVVSIGYKGVIANNLFRLIWKDADLFIPGYWFYSLQKKEKTILDLSGSSSMPAISFSTLESLKVQFPLNPKEQKKIASCLSSLDEVITAESQKLNILQVHKKGLLQNLLPQVGETFPKFRFKDFEYSGDWQETTLTQVANYENGKAHEQDIADDGEFIVVNSKFISQDGEVKKFTNTAFCPAAKGDVLMVLSDIPNGKAIAKCFLVEEDNRYTVNQRICRITPRNIDSKILYYLLNRHPYFLAFDDGVKQTNLRKEDVLNCPLMIPEDPKEQEKIADTLSSIDELIIAQGQKLKALQLHKKGLLQGLFPSINNVE